MTVEVTLGAITAAIGGMLYFIRAENRGDITRIDGRLNGHEAICLERHKHLADSAELDHAQHQEMRDTMGKNGQKLDAIASKIDTVIGQLSRQ